MNRPSEIVAKSNSPPTPPAPSLSVPSQPGTAPASHLAPTCGLAGPHSRHAPGVLIFRPEASLVYFNIDHVCMTIIDRLRQERTPPHLVLLDMSAAPYIDLQSAHALAGLADEICKSGIRLQVVEARSGVRDRLHSEGLDAQLGGINRFTSVADALDADASRTSG